jgi:hypothetical protein
MAGTRAQRDEQYIAYRSWRTTRARDVPHQRRVVPGNMGRNYVTRMIIRRAARFGTKLGFSSPSWRASPNRSSSVWRSLSGDARNQDAISAR